MRSLLFLALLLGLLAVGVELLTRREYPVPAKGSGVVISGASTGIGYHAAVSLADDFVVYAGVRKEADAARLKGLGKANLVPVILDVTSEASVDIAYETITADAAQRGIPVTAVVNNAGIFKVSSVEHQTLADLEDVFNVNIKGVLRLTQKWLPTLRQGQGRIVMVSSVAGFMVIPRASAYCASKHALEAFTDGLRMELSKYNVSVTSVQPGAVQSAIFDKALEHGKTHLEEHPGETAVYGHLIKGKDTNREMVDRAVTPDCTTEAIRDALTSKHPKTRVVVATLGHAPAWVGKILKWTMPDRVLDQMLLAAF